jgi:hypothetical protein
MYRCVCHHLFAGASFIYTYPETDYIVMQLQNSVDAIWSHGLHVMGYNTWEGDKKVSVHLMITIA